LPIVLFGRRKLKNVSTIKSCTRYAVADPGFDLRVGGWTLSTGGGEGIFLLKLCLKLIVSEASKEKIEKN